jgi:hypothetical protein
MATTPPRMRATPLYVVLRHDVPPDHHGVILMHHVVAVHDVMTQQVPEPEEHPHRLIRAQLQHVFAAGLVGLRRDAVAVENLELLKMDVYRVRPASTPFCMVQISVEPCLGDAEATLMSASRPFTVEPPLAG